MSRFSELVILHRKSLHMTQTEYAHHFGFQTPTAVSMWESGQRRVPDKVIEAIVLERIPEYRICKHCHGAGVISLLPTPQEESK